MDKQQNIKCPCCGYYTIENYGEEVIVDICPVCFWQYDEVGHDKPNIAVGGPNRDLSLRQAQKNYRQFGACHKELKQYVREPTEEEKTQH